MPSKCHYDIVREFPFCEICERRGFAPGPPTPGRPRTLIAVKRGGHWPSYSLKKKVLVPFSSPFDPPGRLRRPTRTRGMAHRTSTSLKHRVSRKPTDLDRGRQDEWFVFCRSCGLAVESRAKYLVFQSNSLHVQTPKGLATQPPAGVTSHTLPCPSHPINECRYLLDGYSFCPKSSDSMSRSSIRCLRTRCLPHPLSFGIRGRSGHSLRAGIW